MKHLVVLGTVAMLSACVSVSDAGYYWGNYNKTSYAVVNEPSKESLEAHVSELNRIIDESNKKELRVPPGIYAELGYSLSKLGRGAESEQYFQMEGELYPESRAFIEKISEAGMGGES